MRLGRMEINGGALAVLALLYYLDDNGITPVSYTHLTLPTIVGV